MNRRKWIVGGALALGLIGAGAGIALGTGGGDDREVPIRGEDLRKASAAALEHTGGGRVTGTEQGDEEGYYEVEVTRKDGNQVDVHLDRSFRVISEDSDVDSPSDEDGPDIS